MGKRIEYCKYFTSDSLLCQLLREFRLWLGGQVELSCSFLYFIYFIRFYFIFCCLLKSRRSINFTGYGCESVSLIVLIILGVYKRVTALKKLNPSLKVLLSIGSVNADVFSTVAASEESRMNLARSSKLFLETYNFDGIDVDWEKPYAKDKVRVKKRKF